MSEFQTKIQTMKESMMENLEQSEKNPALIQSDFDLVDDEASLPRPDEDISQESEERNLSSVQRNDKGHRKKQSIKNRLDAVLAENKAMAAQQQQFVAYIQEQERRLNEAQNRIDQSNHNTNAYYEQSLDNDEQRVMSELKFAEDTSDTDKKIELQKRLAEIAAQKQTLMLSKSLARSQPQPVNYPEFGSYPQQQLQQPMYAEPPYRPEFMAQEAVNEPLEDWLEDHSWADERSPDYDPYLANEVNELAAELNKRLKFNRQTHVIGTPQYYNALSGIMQERYGTENNTNGPDNNPEYDNQDYGNNSIYEVAPVTKKGSSMADRYIASKQNYGTPRTQREHLTRDQEVIARNMIPALEKIYNRPFTLAEAKAVYYNEAKNNPEI